MKRSRGDSSPGTAKPFGNYSGYPPDSPMTHRSQKIWVHASSNKITFDGGYYVSKQGPAAAVFLIGWGTPSTEFDPGHIYHSYGHGVASASFEYEVRVVRELAPNAEALDCYVPLNLQAYGYAAIVAQPPANVEAQAILTVPGHYIWDGSEYKYKVSEMFLAEEIYANSNWKEPEHVARSRHFQVGPRRIYVHMTPQRGLVVLPLFATIQTKGTVAIVQGGSSWLLPDNVSGSNL
jgi:hypothetical protein